MGLTHIATASSIMEETSRVLDFMEQQREQRRRLEDNIRRIQTNIKVLYKKTMDCKKVCDGKCREAEQLTQQLTEGKGSAIPVKDIEKLKQKQLKAVVNAEQADANYKSAIDSLEQTRIQWEQETEKTCDDFQLLDEERIGYNRNSMWILTNIGSSMSVREDEMFEEIRKGLEKCDVDADIQLFIRQKQTGSERPECIESENFFGGLLEKNGNSIVQPKPPANMKTVWTGLSGRTGANALTQDHPTLPIIQSASIYSDITDTDVNESIVNDLYDDCINFKQKPKKIQFRVLYDFEGRTTEELSLNENDQVTLIQKETSEWWEVETKDGTKGFFPAIYLELI
uniref:SH3 domain-containing protein n=1 Tax=Strigamia maritima TaxID=126957 RepID=T1IRP6_STRMM